MDHQSDRHSMPETLVSASSKCSSGGAHRDEASPLCFSFSTTPDRLAAIGEPGRSQGQPSDRHLRCEDGRRAGAEIPAGRAAPEPSDSWGLPQTLHSSSSRPRGQGRANRRAGPAIFASMVVASILLGLPAASGDMHSTSSAFASPVSPISGSSRPLRQAAQHPGHHSNLGAHPGGHFESVQRVLDEGYIRRDKHAHKGQARNMVSLKAAAAAPAAPLNSDPPLALCFDFDQTLSQQHVYHLTKKSCNGLAGVDLAKAFGGGERIRSLKRFLDKAKSLGAAVHIISHNHKNDILAALNHVGLGAHFPPESVVGCKELRDSKMSSKTQCAEQIAEGYGLSKRHCLLIDDDVGNLDDAVGAMTYWVSSGAGLNEADMNCIINVVQTMRVAPQRLLSTIGRMVTPVHAL